MHINIYHIYINLFYIKGILSNFYIKDYFPNALPHHLYYKKIQNNN